MSQEYSHSPDKKKWEKKIKEALQKTSGHSIISYKDLYFIKTNQLKSNQKEKKISSKKVEKEKVKGTSELSEKRIRELGESLQSAKNLEKIEGGLKILDTILNGKKNSYAAMIELKVLAIKFNNVAAQNLLYKYLKKKHNTDKNETDKKVKWSVVFSELNILAELATKHKDSLTLIKGWTLGEKHHYLARWASKKIVILAGRLKQKDFSKTLCQIVAKYEKTDKKLSFDALNSLYYSTIMSNNKKKKPNKRSGNGRSRRGIKEVGYLIEKIEDKKLAYLIFRKVLIWAEDEETIRGILIESLAKSDIKKLFEDEKLLLKAFSFLPELIKIGNKKIAFIFLRYLEKGTKEDVKDKITNQLGTLLLSSRGDKKVILELCDLAISKNIDGAKNILLAFFSEEIINQRKPKGKGKMQVNFYVLAAARALACLVLKKQNEQGGNDDYEKALLALLNAAKSNWEALLAVRDLLLVATGTDLPNRLKEALSAIVADGRFELNSNLNRLKHLFGLSQGENKSGIALSEDLLKGMGIFGFEKYGFERKSNFDEDDIPQSIKDIIAELEEG